MGSLAGPARRRGQGVSDRRSATGSVNRTEHRSSGSPLPSASVHYGRTDTVSSAFAHSLKPTKLRGDRSDNKQYKGRIQEASFAFLCELYQLYRKVRALISLTSISKSKLWITNNSSGASSNAAPAKPS